MEELRNFNNEELLELFQKIEEEISFLNSNIINEDELEENNEKEEEQEDDKS